MIDSATSLLSRLCEECKTSRKIQERNLIVKWMRRQTSTEAWRLAKLIEIGIHKETS